MKIFWKIFLLFLFCILVLSRSELQNPRILIKTELGDIRVEIYEKKAPITASNFLKYVDENRFEGACFYRVVTMDNQPNNDVKIEVIQGGLRSSEDQESFPPIEHETTNKTGVLHKDGVISMARSEPGTASSEFFICIEDQPELDFGGKRNPDGQGFAAFGKVIEGMDIVKKIQQKPAERQMLSPRISISNITRINGDQLKELRVNGKRLEQHINELAEFGKNPEGGVSRVAFSKADIQARDYIMSLMRKASLEVHIDEAGNIIGRMQGNNPKLPPILSGSHIDTVPVGGKYDGAVGVLGAIECAQVLHENGIMTDHPLEVVVFTDEEGGLVGSRAMTGTLTPEALEVVSHSGKTVSEGIIAIGGNPEKLSNVSRHKGDIKAFIEIHIEQGATLEQKNIDIGVVEGIVGINWWDVTIEGFPNHAGTTPMNMRQDALLAAAHLIITTNRVITSVPGRQVGTVGRIRAEPGAPNVIPGRVVMSLELRDLSAEKIYSLFEKIKQEAKTIAEKTNTKISFSAIDATAVPAPTDPRIRTYIAEAAKELDLTSLFMPSGAGHDAQDMAQITPTGMIFVPSIGGVSHSPKEYSRPKDIANSANVLLHTILKIDKSEAAIARVSYSSS